MKRRRRKMKIVWTDRAKRDVRNIRRYIASDSEVRAARFVEELFDAIKVTIENPMIGRVVPEFDNENVREVIYKNYRLIYRLGDDFIRVVMVIEGHKLLSAD